MDSILINHNGKIYIIDKDLFETTEETYKRGWFIIREYDKYKNYNELVSRSYIYMNQKKEMIYQ